MEPRDADISKCAASRFSLAPPDDPLSSSLLLPSVVDHPLFCFSRGLVLEWKDPGRKERTWKKPVEKENPLASRIGQWIGKTDSQRRVTHSGLPGPAASSDACEKKDHSGEKDPALRNTRPATRFYGWPHGCLRMCVGTGCSRRGDNEKREVIDD